MHVALYGRRITLSNERSPITARSNWPARHPNRRRNAHQQWPDRWRRAASITRWLTARPEHLSGWHAGSSGLPPQPTIPPAARFNCSVESRSFSKTSPATPELHLRPRLADRHGWMDQQCVDHTLTGGLAGCARAWNQYRNRTRARHRWRERDILQRCHQPNGLRFQGERTDSIATFLGPVSGLAAFTGSTTIFESTTSPGPLAAGTSIVESTGNLSATSIQQPAHDRSGQCVDRSQWNIRRHERLANLVDRRIDRRLERQARSGEQSSGGELQRRHAYRNNSKPDQERLCRQLDRQRHHQFGRARGGGRWFQSAQDRAEATPTRAASALVASPVNPSIRPRFWSAMRIWATRILTASSTARLQRISDPFSKRRFRSAALG